MKRLAFAVLAVSIAAAPALAGDHSRGDDSPSISLKSCCEKPARWADRLEPDEIRTGITTRNGGISLLMTDRVVAMQLSEKAMKKVRREINEEREEGEDNAFARAIKTAVLSGVMTLLDHSVECRIRDVRSVTWDGERLVITANDGTRVFEDIEVDDEDVLANFTERDARAFAADFKRIKRGRSL